MLSQRFIHHQKIGFKEIQATQIPVENMSKELDAFLLHVFSDPQASVFECRIIIRVDGDLIEASEIDPLRDKVLDESSRAFVREQAIYMLSDYGVIELVMLTGQQGQRRIGRAVLEKVGQARSQVVVVRLTQIQKSRVNQYRDDGAFQRFEVVTASGSFFRPDFVDMNCVGFG